MTRCSRADCRNQRYLALKIGEPALRLGPANRIDDKGYACVRRIDGPQRAGLEGLIGEAGKNRKGEDAKTCERH